MLDYAVNDCGIEGNLFLQMFIISDASEQIECGNPKFLAGMSGVEIAIYVFEKTTGKSPEINPSAHFFRSEEYWIGWALAHYQWYTAMRFSTILSFLSFEDMKRMYTTFHEADISKFYAIANEIRIQKFPQTNLKHLRKSAELSQSQLSQQAVISLRSIQMYEQRNRDINKAQAITIVKIARVLSCRVEDLLEPDL
jgi:DNA-binding XRE family transcriptional regulator